MRKPQPREQLIDAVLSAFEDIDAYERPHLIAKQPDLYFALARLAAHDAIEAEMGKRP